MKKETNYWILFGLIIGIGFIARIILSVQLGNNPIWSDTNYYLENAYNVLSGKGYDSAYLRGPLYSYFIAIIFKVLPDSVITIRIVQAVLWIGIILLYYFISLNLFKEKRITIIVTALLSLHPMLIYISSVVVSESLFILIYSLMLLGAYMYRSSRIISMILFSGFCLGLAFYTRSTAFLFLPLMILWLALGNKKNIYDWIKHSIIFIIGFSIIAIPYMVKMHDSRGTWGLGGYGTKFLWQHTVHPLYGPIDNVIENTDDMTTSQLEKVKKYTPNIEKDYSRAKRDRLYKEALLRYIKENPKEYVYKLFGKCLNNFRLTIRTNEKNINENFSIAKLGIPVSLGFIYLFFFIGLSVLKNDDMLKFLPLLAVLLGSLIVFTIYHSRVRFTLSIFPVMIIFSSYGINLMLIKIKDFLLNFKNHA